ncbi:MAG TPA: hypothetical protein DCL41_10400 [Bdellovibrionales bacterium]|nr:hypothetical protein [Bdellovibrionales bacterium]
MKSFWSWRLSAKTLIEPFLARKAPEVSLIQKLHLRKYGRTVGLDKVFLRNKINRIRASGKEDSSMSSLILEIKICGTSFSDLNIKSTSE